MTCSDPPERGATAEIPAKRSTSGGYPTGTTRSGDGGDPVSKLDTSSGRRRFCPMGDLEIRQCIDRDGNKTIAHYCPALEQCVAERRALSNKWNPAMNNEFICRNWPGAHLGIVVEGEEPRWIMRPHRARGCCTPWRAE
jgi:hypothetical protein